MFIDCGECPTRTPNFDSRWSWAQEAVDSRLQEQFSGAPGWLWDLLVAYSCNLCTLIFLSDTSRNSQNSFEFERQWQSWTYGLLKFLCNLFSWLWRGSPRATLWIQTLPYWGVTQYWQLPFWRVANSTCACKQKPSMDHKTQVSIIVTHRSLMVGNAPQEPQILTRGGVGPKRP